jgi:hypothetical protein
MGHVSHPTGRAKARPAGDLDPAEAENDEAQYRRPPGELPTAMVFFAALLTTVRPLY